MQTLQPYTPAHGVNVDTADGRTQVRNLLVISDRDGQGVLSATLTAADGDVLRSVTGLANTADGSTHPLRVTPTPVDVLPGQATVLTDLPHLVVRATGLQAGLTVDLVLRFDRGGQVRLTAPVKDWDSAEYRTVTPRPTPAPPGA